jgi:hypothetical protein
MIKIWIFGRLNRVRVDPKGESTHSKQNAALFALSYSAVIGASGLDATRWETDHGADKNVP